MVESKRVVTAEEIEAGKSVRGGWTNKQLASWGIPLPAPKGWRKGLMAGEYAPRNEDPGLVWMPQPNITVFELALAMPALIAKCRVFEGDLPAAAARHFQRHTAKACEPEPSAPRSRDDTPPWEE